MQCYNDVSILQLLKMASKIQQLLQEIPTINRIILLANIQKSMNLSCKGCENHVLSYSAHQREPGMLLCKACLADNNGLNYIKKTYKLIEQNGKDTEIARQKSQIESLKAQIQAMKEENFSEYFRGNVLGNIMGKQSAQFMQTFNNYVNKINQSQESLKEFVKRSRNQTKVQMRNSIQTILGGQTDYLISSAEAESEDNDFRIRSCEEQRKIMRDKMNKQTFASAHSGQNSNANKQINKYSPKLIQNIMKAFQAEIQEKKKKSVVISSVIQEGEGMIRKLAPERKKNKVDTSKITQKTESESKLKAQCDLFS